MSKSQFFTIMIGPEEDKMFNLMIGMALEHKDFGRTVTKHNIADVLKKFTQQMHEGCKKVEWCNMKGCAGGNCEHKN